MSWRVVIVTRILPIVLGFDKVLRDAGHAPVALLTFLDSDGRYGGFDITPVLREVPSHLDVVMPSKRSSIAPLLRGIDPDLVVCTGFPWKIPPDALAVPRLGWINGHPSLLPRHRGPVPLAWAIRNGDEEFGFTFHRMDAELDTGPILAQRRLPLGEPTEPDAFYAETGPVAMEVLAEALERLAAGDEGRAQEEGGEYESFFGEDDAWLDPSRTALELHRLVWAWRYTISLDGVHGALVELDGETVRVLASSLVEEEGAQRLDCADGPLWLVRTEPAG
ncbi:MAG: methionyl-tRNA formyltransferase [Gaiellaceae bacterium]